MLKLIACNGLLYSLPLGKGVFLLVVFREWNRLKEGDDFASADDRKREGTTSEHFASMKVYTA